MPETVWQSNSQRIIASNGDMTAEVRSSRKWRTANLGESAAIFKAALAHRRSQIAPDLPPQIYSLLDALFMQHPWHGIAPGPEAPQLVNSFIEIVPTDTVKYELDKASGHLKIDRPQLFSNVCPTLYGFIPQTYCGDEIGAFCAQRTKRKNIKGDGDPLDICVLTEKHIAHGNLFVRARPIGGLRMIDKNEADDKIIAVLQDDVVYGEYTDLSDCSPGEIKRLEHYFLTYKQLPGKATRKVEIAARYNRAEAFRVINHSRTDYQKSYGTPEQRILALLKMIMARSDAQ